MTRRSGAATAAAAAVMLVLGATLAGCGGDGDPAGDRPQETYTAPGGAEFNDTDVEFATGMIQHHAQALAMVDLTLGRRLDPDVRQLAEDIRLAQGGEIEQMVDWLTDWGRPVPETVRDHANAHGGGHADSTGPGMLDADRMAALEDATGEDFQRLWLEAMIEHHEAALDMAATEVEKGHSPDAVELAGRISTVQEAEIDKMRRLIGA